MVHVCNMEQFEQTKDIDIYTGKEKTGVVLFTEFKRPKSL